METKQTYTYTSRHTNTEVKVMCTRYEYLRLKLYYDTNGLTPEEYAEYERYNTTTARRMTRKVLDEKAATFNSLFEKSPGVTVQAGFQCYNVITIDPETRRQYGSEINVYGLTNWETAHYLNGLIHAVGYIRNNKATFNK